MIERTSEELEEIRKFEELEPFDPLIDIFYYDKKRRYELGLDFDKDDIFPYEVGQSPIDFTCAFYQMRDGISMDELKQWAKERKKSEPTGDGDGSWTEGINKVYSILNIAKSFRLLLRGDMANCPFHADKTPSLKFYENTGTFKCYGCGKVGNIPEFIYLCKNNKLEEDKSVSWKR